ncbi:hypothetical protein D3C85_1245560 [compost metagenome]
MSSRIEIVEASDISERFPEEILSRLTITMRNGSVIVSPVTAAKGDPETPLTATELNEKYDLFAIGLGQQRSLAVKKAIINLDQSASAVVALTPIFQALEHIPI